MLNRKFYAILAALTANALLMLVILLFALLSQPGAATSPPWFASGKSEELVTNEVTSRSSDWSITLSVVGLLGLVGITTYLATRRRSPRIQRAGLHLITGQASQAWTEARGGQLRIGWGRDNELRLFNPKVSRHHAVIRSARGRFYLQDAGNMYSTGICVNGRQAAAMELNDGDRVKIGSTEFVFRILQ